MVRSACEIFYLKKKIKWQCFYLLLHAQCSCNFILFTHDNLHMFFLNHFFIKGKTLG